MRYLIHFLLFSLSIQIHAQSLKEKTLAVANSEEVKNGRFSFYAKQLGSKEVLIAHDIDRRMSPASTMKLLTTYAALDILGTEHRFSTRMGYTGTLDENGLLVGDIIIEAGGDPALGAEDFADQYGNGCPIERQMAVAIRQAGIRIIQGRIIFDESIYTGIDIPNEWTWQDMGNYFAAAPHAFTYRENMMKFYFKSTGAVGSNAKIVSQDIPIPGLEIVNEVKAADIRSDQAYFYSSPYAGIIRMFGAIPLNNKSFEVKGAMPDPASCFRSVFIEALDKLNITVRSEVIPNPDVLIWERNVNQLIELRSPTLLELTNYTNMDSNNLFAEHLVRLIGSKKRGEGSHKEGINAIKDWCTAKGIDTRGIRIKDGSGLSRANSVTTKFFVDLLSQLAQEPYFESFRTGLPVAGQSGSMRRIGQGSAIDGKMFAKTGYIEDVRAYSGFLISDGNSTVFSIMANDHMLSASQMRIKMSALLEELGK